MSEMLFEVTLTMRDFQRGPDVMVALGVEEDGIVYRSISLGGAVSMGPLPDDLAEKILGPNTASINTFK